MPAWSPIIANALVGLADSYGHAFDQMQLQKLAYIAHGTCLAISGQPLTGDRPEATRFGPMYKRLSAVLVPFGCDLIPKTFLAGPGKGGESYPSELDLFEMDVIARIYHEYKKFPAAKLAVLTRTGDAPWKQIYADGAGESRDIPHRLVRTQFAELVTQRFAPPQH